MSSDSRAHFPQSPQDPCPLSTPPFRVPQPSAAQYVYVRERRDLDVNGQKVSVILAKSVSVPQCPEKSGIVRVKGYKQSLAIRGDGKKGCRVYMYYFDNPGGQIPSWLINWAAKNGVPNFLRDLQRACRGYSRKS
uniref:Phosphatidylcholine transfer protein n=1 Tax=Ornithorhynchus anatinus TaxID=9258 RepID=A0A6I8NS55_ORNAN